MKKYANPPPPIKLAHRIRTQILQRDTHNTDNLQYLLTNLNDQLEQLGMLRRRLSLCQERGFLLARARILDDLRYILRRLPADLTQVEQRIPVERPVLSLGDLVRELQQLEDEFGGWRFEREEAALIVTTEPIELEGISLGTFEIKLDLNRLGRSGNSPPYTVVALEPNPPASKDSVTHPHVSDEHLCEGDAAAAIHGALQEGRVCDFFILVRSVLQTYNRYSPYVALENWHGTPCHDCGYVVDDDDRYYCESCDHDFCSECTGSCSGCDRSLCSSCLEDCPVCNDSVCSRCLGSCSTCGKPCCESCLEEGQCPECIESENKEKNDDESHTEHHEPDESNESTESPQSHPVAPTKSNLSSPPKVISSPQAA